MVREPGPTQEQRRAPGPVRAAGGGAPGGTTAACRRRERRLTGLPRGL